MSLDLLEYAAKHNVSIEITPVSKLPKIYTIRMRRDQYQENSAFIAECNNPEDSLEFVLDKTLEDLERYIRMHESQCMTVESKEKVVKRVMLVSDLYHCNTCYHHKDGTGCDTYCDHGESYRPAYAKLKIYEVPEDDLKEVRR